MAKLPSGDWLWPALWMLPTSSKYGVWPRSGEIDIVESRGNLDYVGEHDRQIGPEQITSTLHFGPSWDHNGYQTSTFSTNRPRNDGFNKEVSREGQRNSELKFNYFPLSLFSVPQIPDGVDGSIHQIQH